MTFPGVLITKGELKFRFVVFGLGSLSIASLLLYFFGVASFVVLGTTLLTIEAAGLLTLGLWVRQPNRQAERRLLVSGLWAGGLATVVYDLVRVPIVHSGIPVFKAISYFGTVLLGVDHPTSLSEAFGWAYHLSNGVSFGLMYAALLRRPGPLTAMAWGLSLEGVMLLTPYAEIFGYQRDARFMSITIGSHMAYGLTLWAALWYQNRLGARLSPVLMAAGFLAVPMSLSAMAFDFDGIYGAKIPHSPPPMLGKNLYTVWNVPEPDRIAAIWIWRRFVNPKAEFYFIEPFERIRFGSPFDVPEAEVRRSGSESATESLIHRRHLASNAKLAALSRMTHLAEITPWMLSAEPEAAALADDLRAFAALTCGERLSYSCLTGLMIEIDNWYGKPSASDDVLPLRQPRGTRGN